MQILVEIILDVIGAIIESMVAYQSTKSKKKKGKLK